MKIAVSFIFGMALGLLVSRIVLSSNKDANWEKLRKHVYSKCTVKRPCRVTITRKFSKTPKIVMSTTIP